MYLLLYNDIVNNKCSIINKTIENNDQFNKYCMQIYNLLNKKHNLQLIYTCTDELSFTIKKSTDIVTNGWFYKSHTTKYLEICVIKKVIINTEYTNYINNLELSLDELINLNKLFTDTSYKKLSNTCFVFIIPSYLLLFLDI